MKKLFAAVLAALLLLTACASKEESKNSGVYDEYSESPETYWNDYAKTTRTDGFYYSSSAEVNGSSRDRLRYVDFKTCLDIVVCSKPNCLHNSSDCGSVGIIGTVVQYEDRIYWFENNYADLDDEGNFYSSTDLWRADLDGTNRLKAASIDDKIICCSNFIVHDGKLWICAKKETFNEYGVNLRENENWLYSYDFSSGDMKCEFLISSGKDEGAYIYGIFNDKLYYSNDHVREAYCYDFETGETEDLEFGLLGCYDGYLLTFENKTMTDKDYMNVTVLTEDGREIDLSGRIGNNGIPYYVVYNDYLIAVNDKVAIDMKTEKAYLLLTENLTFNGGSAEVYFLAADYEGNYQLLPTEKVIGEEIE